MRFFLATIAVAALLPCLAVVKAQDGTGTASQPPKPESPPASDTGAIRSADLHPDVAAARRLIRFGDSDSARTRLSDSIKKSPDNVSVLVELANVEMSEFGRPPVALPLARRAVELSPSNVEALLAFGDAASAVGGSRLFSEKAGEGRLLLEEAAASARKALELLPDNAPAHRLLADIAFRRSHDPAYDEEGKQDGRRQWVEQILVHAEAAIAQDPGHRSTRVRAANTCIELGKPQRALELLGDFDPDTESLSEAEIRAEAALMLDPPDFALHGHCIAVMRRSYDSTFRQVLESISHFAAHQAKAGATSIAIELMHQTHQLEEMSHADRLAAMRPYLPDATPGQPRMRPVIPQFCALAAEAQFEISHSVREAESSKALLREALRYAESTGLSGERLESLEEMVPALPEVAAYICITLGEWDKALKHMRRYSQLRPAEYDASAYVLLIPELAKGNMGIGHVGSFLLIRDKFMSSADRIREMESLVAAAPKFALAQAFLGTLLNESGAHERAAKHLTEALKIWPDHEESLLNLGRAQMQLRQWEASHATFTKLETIRPGYGNAGGLAEFVARVVGGSLPGDALALYLQSMPRAMPADARASLLDRCLTISPEFCEALADRAVIAAGKGDAKLAASLATRASESARSDAQRSAAEAALAEAAVAAGELAAAAAHYKSARLHEKSDKFRSASLAYVEGMVNALAGNHRESTELMASLPAADLMRVFAGEKDAADRLSASLPPQRSGDAIPVAACAPTLKTGQRLTFDAVAKFEVDGGVEPSDGIYQLGIAIECTGTPAITGAWELRVSVEVPADFHIKGMHGLEFAMKINPWFGLSATPPEIENLPPASLIMGNLLVNAVCEIFAGGLGTVNAADRAVFGRKSVPGLLHLNQSTEASVMRVTPDEVAVERLAIADYRDAADARLRWEPRHRMTAISVRDRESGMPRSLELRTERLTPVQKPADVVISRIGIRMDVRR